MWSAKGFRSVTPVAIAHSGQRETRYVLGPRLDAYVQIPIVYVALHTANGCHRRCACRRFPGAQLIDKDPPSTLTTSVELRAELGLFDARSALSYGTPHRAFRQCEWYICTTYAKRHFRRVNNTVREIADRKRVVTSKKKNEKDIQR